jgi:DNA processing protein
MDREELAGWLRLALPGAGNSVARKLLAEFGLPGNIRGQSHQALARVAGADAARAVLEPPPGFEDQVDRTFRWLQDAGASEARHVLTLADARYPAGVLQLADPPLVLYVAGEPRTPWPDAIAIVGSRNPTAQGLVNARQFAEAFARAGLTVVSGLALGIDAAAHEGALAGAGQATESAIATVAVVGTGLDRVYPRQHLALAHRIAARGLIVSEYPIGTPPLAHNFPKRNRLIAAMSHGTLVVEAALQSGSLITAREATEQGKEVFAIPGSIHSPQSRGCHALIRQGAKLVETAQDVLEELPQLAHASPRRDNTARSRPKQDAVLDALGFDPAGLDALVARTGMDAATLQARLLELELEGHVARLAGGTFQRIASA